jgi:hypothetical protein
MPYEIRKSGSGYKVCKKDGEKCFSKNPISKEKAKAQMAALYANESIEQKLNAVLTTPSKTDASSKLDLVLESILMNESLKTIKNKIIQAANSTGAEEFAAQVENSLNGLIQNMAEIRQTMHKNPGYTKYKLSDVYKQLESGLEELKSSPEYHVITPYLDELIITFRKIEKDLNRMAYNIGL